jgi:hypothetical protein
MQPREIIAECRLSDATFHKVYNEGKFQHLIRSYVTLGERSAEELINALSGKGFKIVRIEEK